LRLARRLRCASGIQAGCIEAGGFALASHCAPDPSILALRPARRSYDVALLQIMQRDFSVETHERLQDRDLVPSASLFATRAKRPNRPDSKEIEEMPYTNLEFRKGGITISSNEKGYNICYGDLGAPLFARTGGAQLVVGIIVDNAPLRKTPEESCGSEIHVIDVSVILAFMQSIYGSDR
jgi:hypothetical protein